MSSVRSFSPQPQNITLALRFVRDALRDVETDDGAAELLVTELATNAVEHAESPFSVCVDIRGAIVHIEVINDTPELLATVTQQPSEKGGFGLRLVEALSSHWGTESAESKKVVWFELAAVQASTQ
jgi:hypothetical protein